MQRQIWFLRHGEAEPHGTRADAERRLTERGAEQARNAGIVLAALGIEFAAVLTSPKVRAADTARLAAAAWGGEPEIHEPLAQGFDAEDALAALAAYEGSGEDGARILLVGHEPDFSTAVAGLTGARVDFKKGGVAAVRIAAGGELFVLLRPAELSLIAAAQPQPR